MTMPAIVRGLFSGRSSEGGRQTRASLNAFRNEIRRELDRSRRYERRFALLAVNLAPSLSPRDRQRLAAAIESSLRSSDRYCIAARRLYLLLPEADGQAAQRAFERIRDLQPRALDELSTAIAAFPDDGLTMGALLALLRRVDVARRRRMSPVAGTGAEPVAVSIKRDQRAG